MQRFILAASVAFFLGCAGPTYHTATPTEEGVLSVAVAGSVLGYIDPEDEWVQVLPEILIRRGFTPNLDVGIRGGGAATLDVNYALINSDSFALSVNPSLNIAFVWFSGTLGFLADVLKSPSATLTVGLKPGVFFLREKSTTWFDNVGYYGLGASGVIGGRFQLGHIRLMPTLEVIAIPEDSDRINFVAGLAFGF